MAAKLDGLTLSESEVSQKFNLVELLGTEDIPRSVVLSIGQDMIDTIIKRTESNKSVNGGNLKKYSEEYIESDEFKAYNKSPGPANMTLTGSMLSDLDIISEDPQDFAIGFSDDTEIKKAYNHNVGDTLPKREFFGVTKKELDEIISNYKDEVKREDSSLASLLSAIDFFSRSNPFGR